MVMVSPTVQFPDLFSGQDLRVLGMFINRLWGGRTNTGPCDGRGPAGPSGSGRIQDTHSNCIFEFPVFSLSDCKFSLCQIT